MRHSKKRYKKHKRHVYDDTNNQYKKSNKRKKKKNNSYSDLFIINEYNIQDFDSIIGGSFGKRSWQ